MADRPLTVMFVHAHPDDEATGTGGVIAKYSAEGVTTVLVTCTDGRCGDGPGGVKPGEDGHDPDAVVAMRAGELRRSADILGVTHLEELGFQDSGMSGWSTNDAPLSFWQTPVDEGAEAVRALLDKYRPDVVVTYDPNGFYGHPDHIQAHRVTMAALDGYDLPHKLYWTTVPHSEFERFRQVMAEFGDGDQADPEGLPENIGLPDAEVTTWVDTKAYGEQKFTALQAHASQEENIFFLRMGQERFTDMMGMETFQRIRDNTDAAVPEHDLLAGLREDPSA